MEQTAHSRYKEKLVRTSALLSCLIALLLISCSPPKESMGTNPFQELMTLEDSGFMISRKRDGFFIHIEDTKGNAGVHVYEDGAEIMLSATIGKKTDVAVPCTKKVPCVLSWTINVAGKESIGYSSGPFQIETGKAHFTVGPMILKGEKVGSKTLLLLQVTQEEKVLLARQVSLTVK